MRTNIPPPFEPSHLIRSLWLGLLLVLCWPLGAAAQDDMGGGGGGGGVELRQTANGFEMENGLAIAQIDKHKAAVVSLTLPGGDNLVSRGGITFDAEAFAGHGNKDEAGVTGEAEIVSRGPDVAEVKITDPRFIDFMTAEMHFVMTRGVPGVYEYLVMRHGPGQPAGGVGQLRWVFRGDGRLLTHAFGSATKQGQMVEGDAFQGAKMITDATFSLTPEVGQNVYTEPVGHTYDGLPVYSKYDWTDYAENHVVHGFSSDTEGIFMVQPSMEYYNGGPTKGLLTVHNGPVCILEFLGGHFLIRDNISVHLEDNEQWEQIIGPWLAYVNKGGSAKELWNDAWQRGQTEKAAWPYAWVQEDEELYPHHRGTVSGMLTVPGQKAANALCVLAAPDKDWQVQTMGYEFWTRSDGGGHFTIPKVRPGTYALYASVPGVVGEVKVDNVQVNPDQTTNIGNIQWSPPSRQQLIWRLGVPDRSAGEFRFGDQPRQFGLWWQYMQEMRTRDVNYTIGKSDPKKDWYYAQSVVAMPGVGLFSPRWNINFDMGSTQLTGPVRLTVDLAGTAGERNILHIYLNGREIGQIDSPNDSGIYRDAVKSSDFRHNVIEFDAKNLAQGMNRLTFIIEAGSRTVIATAGGSMPEIPSAGVSYDCVQLEAGPITGDGSYKIAPMN